MVAKWGPEGEPQESQVEAKIEGDEEHLMQ